MQTSSMFRSTLAVLTVEPGLYYHGLGGCRIEDTVHVVSGGCELISKAPYKWEIP